MLNPADRGTTFRTNVTIYQPTRHNNSQDLQLSLETGTSQSIRNYLEMRRNGDCSVLVFSTTKTIVLKIFRFYYLLVFNSVTKKELFLGRKHI
jgi:hypothetical protein